MEPENTNTPVDTKGDGVYDDQSADDVSVNKSGEMDSSTGKQPVREDRSVSGVSVELSREGQRAQRSDPDYAVPPPSSQTTGYSPDGAGMFGRVEPGSALFRTPFGTYVNPVEALQEVLDRRRHRALAIASIILTSISLLCFWMYGFGVIPAVIGTTFGIISLIGGQYSTKTMGAVGLCIGVLGIIINGFVLYNLISVINWDNVSLYNIAKGQNINPNNRQEIINWMQQFFKIDISGTLG